jgi:hypothetical protein
MRNRLFARAALTAVGLVLGLGSATASLAARTTSAAAGGSLTTTIAASPVTLWPTQFSTVTVTASQDVGPTPWYIRVFDVTANAQVASCGFGTSCSVSVTQPVPTSHLYEGWLSDAGGVVLSGSYSGGVYVNWRGVTVRLAASPTTLPVGQTSTLTATTAQDISSSPFYTEIFDATTGAWLATCGTGTTCSASVSQAVATTHVFVAYESAWDHSFPPSHVQNTSNTSYVTWSNAGYRVALSTNASLTFGTATLTAFANQNVGPTPYYIEIFDENGTRVAVCGTGSSCSATVTPSYAGSNYVAFVSDSSSALPPGSIVASSNVVLATRLPIPTAPINGAAGAASPPASVPGAVKPVPQAPRAPVAPVVVPKPGAGR